MATELQYRKNRRSISQKLERVGYVPVRNPDAKDGMFKIGKNRQAVYASAVLSQSYASGKPILTAARRLWLSIRPEAVVALASGAAAIARSGWRAAWATESAHP